MSETLNWLETHKRKHRLHVTDIPFDESKQWSWTPGRESLVHRSGRFFAIRGYRTHSQDGTSWDQPLIHQWEVGIQAFLVRGSLDDLQVLLQAKTEPGNIGTTQASPTLQVTRSNLQQVHQGARPEFADVFLGLQGDIWLNQTYPELGNRYYQKWNENIILHVPDIAHNDRFRWVGLRELKQLLLLDNVVNNDARLVSSFLLLMHGDRYFADQTQFQRDCKASLEQLHGKSFHQLAEFDAWLANTPQLHVIQIPLTQLRGWRMDSYEITDDRQYSVVHLRVESDEREVGGWDQPIIRSQQQGTLGLICKHFNGVLHVLFHAAAQIGSVGPELLPSVCYDGGPRSPTQDMLYDLLWSSSPEVECVVSEEGGRFDQDDSMVRIVVLDEILELPSSYCWLTLGQIRKLAFQQHGFADETRSALAILLAAI